eukprot:6212573-Pleurochrysis_carterae.AAC.1
MPLPANSSVNCFDRNSPALSLCIVPTTRVGVSSPALRSAVKLARNWRMCVGASCLWRSTCTALKRVWSSTMMRAYRRPPSIDGRKGPARSTRVELASAQDAQDGVAACRRLGGASVVYSASRFRLAPPQ